MQLQGLDAGRLIGTLKSDLAGVEAGMREAVGLNERLREDAAELDSLFKKVRISGCAVMMQI